MFYVYILYSASADKYYVGQTQDITQRLLEHNELSENSYTSKHRPWELQLALALPSRSAALRLERHIKSKKRRSYLEYLIRDEELQQKLMEEYSSDGSVG